MAGRTQLAITIATRFGCASTPKRIRLNSNRASRFESFADI
jgi:hypothetical protein